MFLFTESIGAVKSVTFEALVHNIIIYRLFLVRKGYIRSEVIKH